MSTAKLYALAWLSYTRHGGQWSREYRIGCRCHSLLHRKGIANPIDQIQDHFFDWPEIFRAEYRGFYRKYLPFFLWNGSLK